ncbi:MAG: hypothetical protein SGPRY_009720, partial [Prymnesium sp.]
MRTQQAARSTRAFGLLDLPAELLELVLERVRYRGGGRWRAACWTLRRALPEERRLLERLPGPSCVRAKLMAALRPLRTTPGLSTPCDSRTNLTFDEFRSFRTMRVPLRALAPRATVT